jgi:hypothetical protein
VCIPAVFKLCENIFPIQNCENLKSVYMALMREERSQCQGIQKATIWVGKADFLMRGTWKGFQHCPQNANREVSLWGDRGQREEATRQPQLLAAQVQLWLQKALPQP